MAICERQNRGAEQKSRAKTKGHLSRLSAAARLVIDLLQTMAQSLERSNDEMQMSTGDSFSLYNSNGNGNGFL